ncbi:phosphate acetyltransferase [Dellaglioa algida]|uniref:Phosphate acetyltransferase n=1 Tax=Dellaglioa algida TaxID=105612 RepID=A0A2C8EPG5_9LACO|nr:phosphate acetyltransferase [Dellaglioa algida]MDK1716914.1 phosphate acetyltransferase [Dellaglioa algida]MDK1718840.1 phosphate acetyltransferase [Dellaglioa algida]MDK1719688.1 phosphate acetyltransferase [Dellaglioa algida]MDK1721851.1 phosphate acetyltransferase [Dellaglioa algida]MDK1723031.1 phosphate acetyltransferase [Dellaglioa algida]
MSLFESLKSKIESKKIKLVFPEGEEERILKAAVKLAEDNLAEPILLGDVKKIQALAAQLNLVIEGIGIQLLDPKAYSDADFNEMKEAFVARRNGKNTLEQADEMLRDVNYFGTMLVYMGLAEGMVSGAVHATGDTVRPALQIIKTKPGVSRTSGAFIMTRNNDTEKYLFSDAAISINPTAQELAEMAIASIKTARIFDIDPKVAMLSFSTKGSAKSPEVSKVAEATAIAQKLAPDEAIDGELQFDAAFVPSVGEQKAPDSKVAGHANVFIFPELQSGNIGYKIAQRLGGFEAIGPILQGLNQPVSDLSRGANVEEIYKVGIITAAQSLE